MTEPAFCASCGSPRPPGAAFCSSCGKPFDATPAAPAAVWGPNSYPGVNMACGSCGKPLGPTWRGKCNHCGTAYSIAAPVLRTDQAAPVAKRKDWRSGPVVVIAGALVILIFIGLAAAEISRRGGVRSEPRATTGVTSWDIPAGFERAVADPDIAYRWMENPTCLLDSCWGLEVVAREGCPGGLYIELTTLTPDGTVVGFTNDSVGSVSYGGKARMVFDNVDRDQGATKARVDEISCR